ncbi:ATP phosphoribosyltransferase regulatory subunit [Coralliovum pocilloporae]|uniref:ATP phosphoribosyltransferase regulatory subunit n=1 Tax=Coralliovum pocilloporae TaxID=3066369 RepID=UPI003307016C
MDRLADLRRLLSEAGYGFVEPAILHPADLFLEVAGEDIRRRVFTTEGADGKTLCLRPDFTLPVCAMHLAGDNARRPASYAYLGPVFRKRAGDEPDEFLQAGIEAIGDHAVPSAEADASVFALASKAVTLTGVETQDIRLGDVSLFEHVLDSLKLSETPRRLVRRAFGNNEDLSRALDRLRGEGSDAGAGQGDGTRTGGALAQFFDQAGQDNAEQVISELFELAGLAHTGGRPVSDIARRFVEQATLAGGKAVSAEQLVLLERFLTISGTPEQAADALEELGKAGTLDLSQPVAAFRKRMDAMAKAGLDLKSMTFSTDFGRRLSYYTGFIFEIYKAGDTSAPVAGGGRYDALLRLMGAPGDVPAVGFSLWLDRLDMEGS